MPREDKEQEEEQKARTGYDLLRMRLNRLEANIEKPVSIPQRRDDRKPRPPPDFVRNVVGSSAAAGSAEFHIFRNNRKREMDRLDYMNRKAETERLDKEYNERRDKKLKEEAERTAKKRARRQRRKQRMQENKRKLRSPRDSDECSSDSEGVTLEGKDSNEDNGTKEAQNGINGEVDEIKSENNEKTEANDNSDKTSLEVVDGS
ncbi:hypothetical protein AB6A40_007306 [Gnathostoma spinigerum]|uniref:PRKR-interacting protein 1 n=1 Tax=Gnathostoma spinigerum TaxID=75299 RepID=A0ABD6EV86_9BILA